jgi:alpha-beta hydrolase superfamily lysophospholipase
MNDLTLSLEKDFEYRHLSLQPDYEGEVMATFISARHNQGNRKAVLYIHGFIDYFFHPHMAAKFLEQGYDFFALELRKYGRSLLPHQHPNYCRKMDEYFEEIDMALEIIRHGYDASTITLMGHSTGGLLACYYMNAGLKKEWITSLILNSPFLELNEPAVKKLLIPPIARLVAVLFPFAKQDDALSPVYCESLHKDYHGEWDFNLEWKPILGFPAYFAWVKAITEAQSFVKENSKIDIPILLMYSGHSFKPKKYTPETQVADTVLNVNDIAERGMTLGSNVTKAEIKDGMHDLFLSRKDVREEAFTKMFEWLRHC